MYVGAILDSNQPAYWPRKPNQLIIWFILQVNAEEFCHIQILAKMKLSGITQNHLLVIHDGQRHEQTTQLKRTKTIFTHSYEKVFQTWTPVTNITYTCDIQYILYIYICLHLIIQKGHFRNKTSSPQKPPTHAAGDQNAGALALLRSACAELVTSATLAPQAGGDPNLLSRWPCS